MIRAHQPGSEPIDIPETIPNPVVVPKPTPTPTEPAPKEPVPGEGSLARRLNGRQLYVWHAWIAKARSLDILVQSRRDRKAALKRMRKAVQTRTPKIALVGTPCPYQKPHPGLKRDEHVGHLETHAHPA